MHLQQRQPAWHCRASAAARTTRAATAAAEGRQGTAAPSAAAAAAAAQAGRSAGWGGRCRGAPAGKASSAVLAEWKPLALRPAPLTPLFGFPCRLARMRSARPAVGSSTASGGTASPERAFSPGPSAAAAAGGAALLPQVEAAQRLTQLLDGVINLLAGKWLPMWSMAAGPWRRASALHRPHPVLEQVLPAHAALCLMPCPPLASIGRCSHGARRRLGQGAPVPAGGADGTDGALGAHGATAAGAPAAGGRMGAGMGVLHGVAA